MTLDSGDSTRHDNANDMVPSSTRQLLVRPSAEDVAILTFKSRLKDNPFFSQAV
jgi:hypothetical protein